MRVIHTMSRWTLVALLLGLLLVAAPISRVAAEEDEYGGDDDEEAPAKDDSEKDVVVLTSKNFDEVVKGSKFALVEFYAPWCGHCKKLAPEYARAATALKASNPDVVIAKVDATADADLASKFGVQGYPTLKWFVDGDTESPSDYNGGRDEEGIIKWIKKKSGPAAVQVDDAGDLKALEDENPVMVVGYFSAFEGTEYDVFMSVARKVEDAAFVKTTIEEAAKAAGIKAAPGIAIVKNFAKLGEPREEIPFTGDVSEDALKEFVKSEKLPITIEFSSDNSDKIFNSGINKQLILWTKASDLEADADVLKAYKAVSKKFKGQLVFVTSNNEGSNHEPITNFFGLKDQTPPVVLGFQLEKNKKFKMQEPFSEAAVEAFAQSMVDGTAQPEFKSAPVPEGEAAFDGDVAIVVGKSVDTIVKDENKDVLLEVYAPWCGHCKQLEPIYKKLAKRFKKVDSVVIAKMDGTENEHPDIEAKGFPTLLFFPAGADKTPIAFEGGDRSLKALTKFIKKNAKVPFELPKKAKGEEKSEKDEL